MKTVLITGSSSGIGRAIAHYFQSKGWQVAATMRKPENEQDLDKLENTKLYALNVCDKHSIQEAINSAIDDFGGIDVIVNNAGYGLVGPFEASTEEQIQRQFDTNVFGLMNVTRAIIPHFRECKSGTIINITSVGGRLSFPLYSLYNSTKWAVEGFSESLQYELRQFGIKVKLIEPGAIKTDFYDLSMELNDEDEALDSLYEEIKKRSNFKKDETFQTSLRDGLINCKNDTFSKTMKTYHSTDWILQISLRSWMSRYFISLSFLRRDIHVWTFYYVFCYIIVVFLSSVFPVTLFTTWSLKKRQDRWADKYYKQYDGKDLY